VEVLDRAGDTMNALALNAGQPGALKESWSGRRNGVRMADVTTSQMKKPARFAGELSHRKSAHRCAAKGLLEDRIDFQDTTPNPFPA
jgi:hypothetical protein